MCLMEGKCPPLPISFKPNSCSFADVLKTPCFWLPGRHHSHPICCGLLQSARFRQTTTGLCHSPLKLNKTRKSQRTLSCRGNHQSNSTLFLALVTLLDNIEIRFACVHSRQLAPRLSPDVQPRRAREPSNHVPHGARQVSVRRDRRWRSNSRATNCSPKEGSEGKLSPERVCPGRPQGHTQLGSVLKWLDKVSEKDGWAITRCFLHPGI